MRAIWTACAGLAALGLTSCDINTGAPATAQNQCHCSAPTAAPSAPTAYAPPAVHHRRYRHAYGYAYSGHRAYGGHGYAWHREWSEVSVQTYDYHSDSHSYAADERDDAYSGSGARDRVDGDGRGQGSASAGSAVSYAGDRRDRMSVWHGYDADCPDKH